MPDAGSANRIVGVIQMYLCKSEFLQTLMLDAAHRVDDAVCPVLDGYDCGDAHMQSQLAHSEMCRRLCCGLRYCGNFRIEFFETAIVVLCRKHFIHKRQPAFAVACAFFKILQ